MTSAQLGDVTIEYEVDGPDDGEPMLLVMGLGAQLVAWPRDVVEGLVERGFRVIRMDNRDIGLSTKTDAPVPTRAALFKAFAHRRYAQADYLLSDMAADAVALLDHLGVRAAHVVGVSMGGMIAQQPRSTTPSGCSACARSCPTPATAARAVAPGCSRTMAVSMTTPRPEDLAEAERRGIEGFRLIAGPHFDEDEITVMVRMALARNINPLGTIRQLLAIQASPDRTPDCARCACRPSSSTACSTSSSCRAAGSPRRGRCPVTPGHVPGHGARPARAPAGGDRRGDHPERPPGAGRVGRTLTASTRPHVRGQPLPAGCGRRRAHASGRRAKARTPSEVCLDTWPWRPPLLGSAVLGERVGQRRRGERPRPR